MAAESQRYFKNIPLHLLQPLMPECVSYLVGVLCKSVGVPLAEVRAEGAAALSLDPAEVVPVTLLSEADRGLPSDGDLAWLQLHGPSKTQKRAQLTLNFNGTGEDTATLWFHT